MNKIVFLLFFFFFFNFNVFADVKDDIAKINDLKETGLLTDQDYKNLLEKSIIQTEEYKKIKGLFDSEIINLEEFINTGNRSRFIKIKPNDTIIVPQKISSYVLAKIGIINTLFSLLTLYLQLEMLANR